MACIAKRRGRYVIDFYDNRGKRRWITLPEGSQKKDAKDKLREIEDQVMKGLYIPTRDIPRFKKVASGWLEYKKANVRGSTWNMYRGHVENHFAQIDNLKVNRITIATVEKFITERREQKVSLATLKKVLGTLGQVLKYAVRHRYIDHNPVSEAERPKDKGKEKAPVIRVLTPTEINAMLAEVQDQKFFTLFMLAVSSGAREGELFGLKWSDVLWNTNQIYIQRTFNNGAWYRPKSKTSIRKIDLGPTAMKQLKMWKLACPPSKLDLVFPNESGKPINHGYMLRYHFWLALKDAELPKIRFHDLRHTFASLLIDQGENIKYIQKQLGHSKPTVTLDIYTHLFNDNDPKAAKRLDEKIFKNGSKMVADG
jgi:integrase